MWAGALVLLLSVGCGTSAAPPQGAVLWLLADTGVSADEDGRLAGWADLSGYGHDAEVIIFPPGIARTADPPDRRPRLIEQAASSAPPTLLTFDGSDDLMGIADVDPLNLGGPYDQRTIFLAFRTGEDVERRQMLFETGGDLRGFNIYLYQGQLYLGAFNVWNDDRGLTTPFGPAHITANVAPRTTYVATLQFDHPGGALTGYLNGVESGQTEEIGRVFLHHEDTGIGAINEDTYYHDGQRQAVPAADYFGGGIGAILVYNTVLSGADRASTETWLMNRFSVKAEDASSVQDDGSSAGAASPEFPALYVASGLGDVVPCSNPVSGAPAGGYALGAMYVGR